MASAQSTNRRLLLTSITTTNINSAVAAWVTNATSATAIYGDITGWDMSAVTSLHKTFYQKGTFNDFIGAWDTAAVTTLEYTFYDADAFNQDIGGWDTGVVTNMYQTFGSTSVFDQDVSGWDTGAVKTLHQTFYYASTFNQDIGGWNTTAVTSFYGTFYYAPAFTQTLCWDTTGIYSTFTFMHGSPGSTAPNAAKCACGAGAFYNGTGCQLCPAGQDSNGKTESCYILPTPAPTPVPTRTSAPSLPPTSLYTSISTSNIKTAVAAWLSDSATASATYGNISDWDTSMVTSLAYTFYGKSTFDQNIGGWDTSAVTTLVGTFSYAYAFNQDIGGWDTSAVTSLANTFTGSYGTKTIFNQDIGGWDTSVVITMHKTFEATSRFNQNIGGWDTGAVTSLQNMFHNALAFNQDIGGWNTGAVTTLAATFYFARAFNQNIGSWNIGKVTSLTSTFFYATAFKQDINAWDTAEVTSMTNMFHLASAFNQNIGGWDTSAVTTLYRTFYRASAFNQDIGAWDTSAVTSLQDTFAGSYNVATTFNQDIGGWDTSAVTTLSRTFYRASVFNQDIGGWDTRAVTFLYYTFYYASAFNQDIGGWDTGAVTSLQNTFEYATAFNQNIGGWDTRAVTSLYYTFYAASAFNQDIGGWDTGAVTTLYYTFYYARAFNQDIGGWDTGAVTTLEAMFQDAYAFNQTLCWNTTGKTTTYMFYDSPGSTNPSAAKCACTAGEFYNGSTCQSCPAGQDSIGKTESCYILPTPAPTLVPSLSPSALPTLTPTPEPSLSLLPSTLPSPEPSPLPSALPTPAPTLVPSSYPSALPTPAPTKTLAPTPNPIQVPSARPTHLPSGLPSWEPSPVPSLKPSHIPLPEPSAFPSFTPTLPPTRSPSALPTLNDALDSAFSVNSLETASANPLITGGIFILCVFIANLICLWMYNKCKAAHSNNNGKNERSSAIVTSSVASEAALLAQIQAASDNAMEDASTVETADVGFADEEAASELETMAKKHVKEIERFKLSTEAKMKIRQRKISRLEREAAQVYQEREALHNKVAELSEELLRLQGNSELSKPSTGCASEDDNSRLPMPPPHGNIATTAIPNELLKGLLGDSAAPVSKKEGAASDDDPRARVMKAGKRVGGAGNVRVAVRVRPPNQRELAGEGNGVCVDVVPADGIVKVSSDKAFTFDVAFSMEATQAEVFDNLGVDLVGWVLGGYNASVFAYGQTSSGKTHSMMGARDSEVLRGLIPRVISLLWECVQAFLNENSKHDCVLKASYLEIYNEEIRDLLGKCEKLKLRNDPKTGIFASGLTMFPLKSSEEAMECIERGARLRSVAATKFNSESSRSHAVFEIHISKTYPTDSGDMVSTSRLSLTDLAGSERSSKVGTTGTSLHEGNNINNSLSTLGRCIAVLVDISQGKKGLAPFRDSVLTLYLRDALAGNVLTTMLANVSPVSANMEETLPTLRFAASAKRIKTKVTKNEDLQQKRIRELTEELEAVKKELAMQIKLAEGAKKLVLHLNGEMPDVPSDDEDEPTEAGEATVASIRRSSITDRRGSIRDAALLEAYDDEAGDATSALAAPVRFHPPFQSRTRMPKTPPQQHPRLAARKSAFKGKQGPHVTL